MNYALVHGAWHGGWCWDRVRPLLEAAGHKVYTPTLTGLGERSDLLSPKVVLEEHVKDVQQQIENAPLTEVVLVGHSYAGAVMACLADCIPDRIAHLVYLDAIVPRSGQCLLDLLPDEFQAWVDNIVQEQGEGWMMPVQEDETFGLKNEEDLSWVRPRLVPHPYKTYQDIVGLEKHDNNSIKVSYISCVSDDNLSQFRDNFSEGIDGYHKIVSGHDVMVMAPKELSELIQKISNIC